MSDAHAGSDAGHSPTAHPHGAVEEAEHDAGHDDAHGHGGAPLGGIAWGMWLAGIVGVAAGLLVVAAFVYGAATTA